MMKVAKMLRIVFLILLSVCCAASFPARAQNCDTVYEVIETLRKQDLGTYSLWDTMYGEKTMRESFDALDLSMGTENVIAAGMRAVNRASDRSLLLVEIDRRGRPVWEKDIEVKGLERVVKIMTMDDLYAVLANRKDEKSGRKNVWIGLFDKEGALKHEAVISDKADSVSATDFIVTHDMKSFLVSAVKEKSAGQGASVTALYWVNIKTRKVTKDVAYAFGAENRINALDYLGDNHYIGAGSVRGADNRLSGWIIHVNEQGGFVWQKPYPRGLGGRFNDVVNYNDRYLAVTGETMPAEEEGKRAGWMMMVSADTGDAAWQRYYREDYNMTGIALARHDDGQVSVIFNGWGSDNKDNKDYVRLLTMNGRGVMLQADSYFHAMGAQARGMMLGRKKERVIYGDTLVEYQLEKETQDDKTSSVDSVTRSHDGWIVAGSASDLYRDPCVRRLEYLQ